MKQLQNCQAMFHKVCETMIGSWVYSWHIFLLNSVQIYLFYDITESGSDCIVRTKCVYVCKVTHALDPIIAQK